MFLLFTDKIPLLQVAGYGMFVQSINNCPEAKPAGNHYFKYNFSE